MNGVINIYKPVGITSFDAVKKVMNLCGTKKVGHTGTLDPLASGVLPICIGRGTKLVDFIMSGTKVYRAELRLGVQTDTYDREGKVIEERKVDLTEDEVRRAFKLFIGEIEQEPPMYSAIKVNGKKLYELAREGIVIERTKRKVTIFNIDIINIDLPLITFDVKCSKGTYIRSLCHDIGMVLGTGGTMWNLERSETGIFTLENSVHLDDLTRSNISEYVISLEDALSSYDKLSFSSKYEKLLLNGVKINNLFLLQNIELEKLYRVYLDETKFIGIGIRDDAGFKITKLLI